MSRQPIGLSPKTLKEYFDSFNPDRLLKKSVMLLKPIYDPVLNYFTLINSSGFTNVSIICVKGVYMSVKGRQTPPDQIFVHILRPKYCALLDPNDLRVVNEILEIGKYYSYDTPYNHRILNFDLLGFGDANTAAISAFKNAYTAGGGIEVNTNDNTEIINYYQTDAVDELTYGAIVYTNDTAQI